MKNISAKVIAVLLGAAMMPFLAACGGSTDSGLEYKETHIRIGHEEIMNGDPHSIIDPLWWEVRTYEGEKAYNEDLDQFSLPQRYIFAIQCYMAEVNNGGHWQFYYNSSGIVYPDALQGFLEIGHQQAYDILNETIALAGGKIPLDRSRRIRQLDRLSDSQNDAMEALDMAFFEIDDLDEKMMAYIKANESDFYFDGTVMMPEWPELDWDSINSIITFASFDTTAV